MIDSLLFLISSLWSLASGSYPLVIPVLVS